MPRTAALTIALFLLLPFPAGAEGEAPAGQAAPEPTPWSALRARLRTRAPWRWTENDSPRRSMIERLPARVMLGLRWLAAHQAPSGSWEAAGFHRWLDGKPHAPEPPPEHPGLGLPMYDVGVTGLALAAFLVAGWDGTGAHAFDEVVRRGLGHLRARQDAKGRFGEASTSPEEHRLPEDRDFARGTTLRNRESWSYNQACATLAMVEAAALTGDAGWTECAQRAIRYAEVMRQPYFVWGYGEAPSDCNTSVTTWMMLALGTARLVNEAAQKAKQAPPFELPDDAFTGVRNWVDLRSDPETGSVGYTRPGQISSRNRDSADLYYPAGEAPLAAAGLVLRRLLGDRLVEADVAARTVRRHTPREHDPADFVYWHLGGLGLYAVGGDPWRQWMPTVEGFLVARQRTGEPVDPMFHGSWDPLDAWGKAGGRVYATALNVLTLMTRIRYEGKGR